MGLYCTQPFVPIQQKYCWNGRKIASHPFICHLLSCIHTLLRNDLIFILKTMKLVSWGVGVKTPYLELSRNPNSSVG